MAQFAVHLISPLTNLPTDSPAFSPGQSITGQLSSITDLKSVSKIQVELSGWQYSTASQTKDKQHIDEKSLNYGKGASGISGTFASLALQEGGVAASPKAMAQFTRKRLFSHSTEISSGLRDGMTFSVNIPHTEDPDKQGRSAPLPPSLHLGKRTDSTVVGYNRYQVKVTVRRKGMFKKDQTIATPFLLIPLSPSSPPPLPTLSTILTSSTPTTPPPFPEKWQSSESRRCVLASGDSFFTQTAKDVGGKLGGLFGRKGSEKGDGGREEVGAVNVQLGVPYFDTWPIGVPVPYHLTLTTDKSFQPPSYSEKPSSIINEHSATPHSATTNILDPSRLSLNFLLGQMYITKAGSHESMQPRLIRGVAPGEKAYKPGMMAGEREQVSGGRVEVTREGIWVDEGGERMVVVGTVRLGVLPASSSGLITALPYKLHVELSLTDPTSTLSSPKRGLAEDLFRPKISVSSLEGLSEQDVRELVHESYWNEVGDLDLSDNALYQG